MCWKRSYSFVLKLASTSKFSGVETLKREGRMDFSGTLGGPYGSTEEGGLLVRDETWWMLVQWVLSRPMLLYHVDFP
jgi:hypothetical protein